MGFKLLDTKKFIKERNAKQVLSAKTFTNQGGEFKPDPQGLYSDQIFGYTQREKLENFGFIDLKTILVHPLIFKNISKINSLFKKIIEETVAVEIVNGELIEIDKEPSRQNSGINFLYNNWDKIDFNRYKKETNEFFIEFMKKVQKKLTFINEIPVIPVAYRPYSLKHGRPEIDEITEKYSKILNSINSNSISNMNNHGDILGDPNLASMLMDHLSNTGVLQNQVNQLYDYFISKLEKKQGFFRGKLIGKRLDNVTRLVANARPDVPIDCAILPWHVLINMFDVFVIAYLTKFPETAEKLGIKNLQSDDLGKHFYYIYKNCDIYCKTYPEKQDIWIEILEYIFEKNPYLRILMKRDPGWSAGSFWVLKPAISKGCKYHIVVPSFYYVPLGGDSFYTNIFIDFQDKEKTTEFNGVQIKYNKYNKICTLDTYYKNRKGE